MQSISTIGLDIAKSVFQVHGIDAAGQVVVRRQLRRRHRARQQARQDGLGHDGQERTLQGTGRAHGLNEITPDKGNPV